MHFADRLIQTIRDKGAPICVGLDPVYERLPASLSTGAEVPPGKRLECIEQFCNGVLEAVAEIAPCVKLQSACFERYGQFGVGLYHLVVAKAQANGLIVIGDAKRGDIGISAAHYAAGCLNDLPMEDGESQPGPDALTINAYFGSDGVEPFIDVAREHDKGLFALVRTSNPGGDAIQNQQLADGRTVAQMVGQVIAQLGAEAVQPV